MPKPSIRELLDDIENVQSAYELAARVERVLALHRCPTESGARYADACPACGEFWPCPTVRVLEGEEAGGDVPRDRGGDGRAVVVDVSVSFFSRCEVRSEWAGQRAEGSMDREPSRPTPRSEP